MRITLGLLAGELGLRHSGVRFREEGERNIALVRLAEEADGAILPDCLYLCGGAPPEALLREGANVLFTGEAPPEQLPPNCIFLPAPVALAQLRAEISEILLRILGWHNRLLACAGTETDPGLLIAGSGELFPGGLWLLSIADGRVYPSGTVRAQAPDWESWFRYYYVPGQSPPVSGEETLESLSFRREVFTLRDTAGGGYLMIGNVFCDGVRVAALAASFPNGDPGSRYHTYLTELTACAEIMYRHILSEAGAGAESVLLHLLKGEPVSEEEINAYYEEEPCFRPGHSLRVFVFRAEEDYQDSFRANRLLYRCILTRLYSRSRVLIYSDYIVLIHDFTLSKHTGSASHADYFLRLAHIVPGVSAPFSDPADLRTFFQQALAVAREAKSAKQMVHDYSRYLAYDVVGSFAQTRQLRNYIHPDIHRLAAEDEKGRSDLLATLYCYLLNDRSYQLCAEKLHIHRNSFAYRIQKVQKLLESDINEEDQRMSLILSIYMYWYLHPEADPIGISAWAEGGLPERMR